VTPSARRAASYCQRQTSVERQDQRLEDEGLYAEGLWWGGSKTQIPKFLNGFVNLIKLLWIRIFLGIRVNVELDYDSPVSDNLYNVGFAVVTSVVLKSTVCWDIAPYSPLKDNRCFKGKYLLPLQGRRINHARDQDEARSLLVTPCWFLAWLIL
jgi:hypothetical protein